MLLPSISKDLVTAGVRQLPLVVVSAPTKVIPAAASTETDARMVKVEPTSKLRRSMGVRGWTACRGKKPEWQRPNRTTSTADAESGSPGCENRIGASEAPTVTLGD